MSNHCTCLIPSYDLARKLCMACGLPAREPGSPHGEGGPLLEAGSTEPSGTIGADRAGPLAAADNDVDPPERAAHTPGPWKIVRYTNYNGFSIASQSDPSYGCIAERWEAAVSLSRAPTRLANAHLIAAAPELMAELQNIANADPSKWESDVRDQFQEWAQNRARAAIAKAKGEA